MRSRLATARRHVVVAVLALVLLPVGGSHAASVPTTVATGFAPGQLAVASGRAYWLSDVSRKGIVIMSAPLAGGDSRVEIRSRLQLWALRSGGGRIGATEGSRNANRSSVIELLSDGSTRPIAQGRLKPKSDCGDTVTLTDISPSGTFVTRRHTRERRSCGNAADRDRFTLEGHPSDGPPHLLYQREAPIRKDALWFGYPASASLAGNYLLISDGVDFLDYRLAERFRVINAVTRVTVYSGRVRGDDRGGVFSDVDVSPGGRLLLGHWRSERHKPPATTTLRFIDLVSPPQNWSQARVLRRVEDHDDDPMFPAPSLSARLCGEQVVALTGATGEKQQPMLLWPSPTASAKTLWTSRGYAGSFACDESTVIFEPSYSVGSILAIELNQ